MKNNFEDLLKSAREFSDNTKFHHKVCRKQNLSLLETIRKPIKYQKPDCNVNNTDFQENYFFHLCRDSILSLK